MSTSENNQVLIKKISSAKVPTVWGVFTCHVYESLDDGEQHLAFVYGDMKNADDVLVRVHSECVTGDVFQSLKCDCGHQLHLAMEKISQEGGVLVYLRGHEGRGIGIGQKIDAYRLQEEGLDTVEANKALGLPVDSREYSVGAKILKDLGVTSMRLITNNLAKLLGLQGHGVEINDRVSVPAKPTAENLSYLKTKKEKLGHLIDGLEE